MNASQLETVQHLKRTFSIMIFGGVARLSPKPHAASIDRSIIRKKRTFQRKTCSILSRTPPYLPTSIKTKPPNKPHFTLLYCTSPSSISIRYSYFDVLEPSRVSPGGGESPYTIRSGLDLVEGSAEEKSWFYFFFFFFFRKNEQDRDECARYVRSLITHSTNEPNPPN